MSKRSPGRINYEYYMANELLDNKTFEDLFELHFTKLMGFVFNYVRDEEVAKDIVHDAFLTLWSNRKRLNPVYPVKSYLFTLAQNCALNYLRHLRVVTGNEQAVTELLEAANEAFGGKIGAITGKTARGIGKMCGGREEVQGGGGRIRHYREHCKNAYYPRLEILTG